MPNATQLKLNGSKPIGKVRSKVFPVTYYFTTCASFARSPDIFPSPVDVAKFVAYPNFDDVIVKTFGWLQRIIPVIKGLNNKFASGIYKTNFCSNLHWGSPFAKSVRTLIGGLDD